MFDFAACKCKTYGECIYARDSEVTKSWQGFLKDQRKKWFMAIGGLNFKMTQKLALRLIKKMRMKDE